MKRGGNHLSFINLHMTWLITGGTGQLGTALSKELAARGIRHASWGSQDLDITNTAIVQDSIFKVAPEVILNCAAWTDVDGAEHNELLASKVNASGAENIAQAAKLCDAKLIHISTDYVFSGHTDYPWEVDALINPQSIYGKTKADGEFRVLSEYPERSSIVRTAWLYSPWGNNFAKTMTSLALGNRAEIRVVNDQVGQPTSAADLAKQLVELGISSAPSGIYHGTNAGQATWFQFAEKIFDLVGADKNRIIPVSSIEFPRLASRPIFSVLSHDAWSKTSIRPMRNWQNALADVMPSIISAVKGEE
jgi:dTDP-4-dehydrorhamnose reductase